MNSPMPSSYMLLACSHLCLRELLQNTLSQSFTASEAMACRKQCQYAQSCADHHTAPALRTGRCCRLRPLLQDRRTDHTAAGAYLLYASLLLLTALGRLLHDAAYLPMPVPACSWAYPPHMAYTSSLKSCSNAIASFSHAALPNGVCHSSAESGTNSTALTRKKKACFGTVSGALRVSRS